MEEPFQGLILQSTLFRENRLIIRLLTQELGVISLVANQTKSNPLGWVEPLVVIRGKAVTTRGDLFKGQELTGIGWFWNLRKGGAPLKAAKLLLKTISRLQEEKVKDPPLYNFVTKLLSALDGGADPLLIESLFLAKYAWREGVLDLSEDWTEEEETYLNQILSSRSILGIMPPNTLKTKLMSCLFDKA